MQCWEEHISKYSGRENKIIHHDTILESRLKKTRLTTCVDNKL